jgi:hypothetical protein
VASSLDFNAVPSVHPLIALGLIHEVKNSNSQGWILQRGDALPATGVGGL